MEADRKSFTESDLTEKVIGIFYSVYNELGPGFLESIYENAMKIALQEAGLATSQQVPLAVWFRNRTVGEFRMDLLVENKLALELKAVSQLMPLHAFQLVNYLKATRLEVGLLLNFGPRPQLKRCVYGGSFPYPLSSALIRVQK